MDKLKFTDWSEVHRRFASGEIMISQQRMMIAPPSLPSLPPHGIIRVNIKSRVLFEKVQGSSKKARKCDLKISDVFTPATLVWVWSIYC